MSLAQLQNDFIAFIRSGDRAIDDHVEAASRPGLAVYHYAFRANLTECLRNTFEKTHAWLGDAQFDAAAATHISHHAPESWTLSAYGHGFDATLAMLYPNDPEVRELAWLDWSLRRAFDGPDSAILDPQSLAAVDWDSATLALAPTLAIRPIVSNVAEIWNAIASGGTPPPARMLDQTAALIVWRQDLSPRFQAVSTIENDALAMAMAGKSFGEICNEITPGFPSQEDAAAFAGAMLGRWFGDGIVVAVS